MYGMVGGDIPSGDLVVDLYSDFIDLNFEDQHLKTFLCLE